MGRRRASRNGGARGHRSGVTLAVLGLALLVLPLLASPAAAQATIQLSVAPTFPALVTVGQANQPAQLQMSNFNSSGVGPITLTEIALNPACGSLSLDCSPPDPGVFALSGTATGTAGACAGRSFTISAPDANGRSLFTPSGGPVVLATPGQTNSSCTVAFTFNVLKAPTVDAQPSAQGLQTAAVARITGTGEVEGGFTGTGTARGLQTINVNKARPTLATRVSPGVIVGGSISDTAAVNGPVAVTGTVTFRLYGPNDAACTGAAAFTSTKPLVNNTATSDSYTTTQPGTYRFVATYNGDADNLPVTGTCGDPKETVIVGQDGGRYAPLSPARILDTRTGTGGFDTPVGPGATIDVQATGRGGVPPSGVSAVVMNVAVTGPTSGSYLTVYPAGGARPTASNLNFTAGDTVANLVVVKLGSGGKVSMFNSSGNSHVVADVAGWYSQTGAGSAGRYEPLVPARLLDTRVGIGGPVAKVGPGGSAEVQVAGMGGVPASGAQAAVLNVTATNPSATGYLTVHPSGEAQPLASNLNFDAGETVANRVMAKLGANGRVRIFNSSGTTDLIVDVGGWYTDAAVGGLLGTFTALDAARIVDTRLGVGDITGPVGGGTTAEVQVAGRGGIPASGVRAVAMNVTVVSPSPGGYLTLFPTGAARPNASDLNFSQGEIRANLAVVGVGTDGKVNLFTSAGTHFIFDVAGWYA